MKQDQTKCVKWRFNLIVGLIIFSKQANIPYDFEFFPIGFLYSFCTGYRRSFPKPTKFCCNANVYWADVALGKYFVSNLECTTGWFEWKANGIVCNDIGIGGNCFGAVVVRLALSNTIHTWRRLDYASKRLKTPWV